MLMGGDYIARSRFPNKSIPEDCIATFTLGNRTYNLQRPGDSDNGDLNGLGAVFDTATCHNNKTLDVPNAQDSVKCLPVSCFV